MRLEIESVVVTDATGAEAVDVAALLDARPDPFCEIESGLLWHLATAHATWSRDWYPGCRRRCDADRSARSVSTVTACDFASKARTATRTSGCPSTSRSTT